MASATITLRIPPGLADALRSAARERGLSMNSFATTVLGAAVDPDLAGTEVERLRERLGRAGLLAEVSSLPEAPRPGKAELERARAAAGRGTQLSDLVSEGRR